MSMIIGSLFEHSDYLGKALDAAWTRNNVIDNNISNIDTPDFKASKVEFESILSNALDSSKLKMKKDDPRHLGKGQNLNEITPVVTQDIESDIRMDGNNVDMNTEQSELAQNTLRYYTLLNKLSNNISTMRYVIESR